MSSVKYGCLLLLLLLLTACGEIADDLTPSGTDQRPTVAAGTTGWAVGQIAPPFSLLDINGTNVDLTLALAGKKGAVLYFTMWCPICNGDMSDLLNVMPDFSTVRFFAVDYISGSVAAAQSMANSEGFINSDFTILADVNQQLLHNFNATMATTIVIDSSGVIRMNEEYKGDARLREVLSGLP